MTDNIKTFADFNVESSICEALTSLGITAPFPIQELTLPLALAGADLIGQARTGTGKTLAFGIPLLQNVNTDDNRTQALVIVPTRELCLQVHDDLKAAGARKGTTIVAAYGGRAIDPQSEAIAGGAEVVVGTPGRLLDLMRRGLLDLSTVATLVLDEADEMLDMGFLPDVEQLIEATASKRQTLLFSATMPSEVVALARRYMTKPTFMRADVEESGVGPATRQHFFAVHRMDKPALVARILATDARGRCVIFTRTKRMADMLVKDLRDADLNAAAIHSDLRQEAREKTLARFRAGNIDVMCATEVAARGLDIDEVTHVINYDCPDDEKMYLHRIGRTGRAGADGVAVTLAIWSELARLDMIKKALAISEETLEVFSTSDILDELFPLSVPVAEETSAPVESRARAKSKAPESRARAKSKAPESRARAKSKAPESTTREQAKTPKKTEKPASDKSQSEKPQSDKPQSDRLRTPTTTNAEVDSAPPTRSAPAARKDQLRGPVKTRARRRSRSTSSITREPESSDKPDSGSAGNAGTDNTAAPTTTPAGGGTTDSGQASRRRRTRERDTDQPARPSSPQSEDSTEESPKTPPRRGPSEGGRRPARRARQTRDGRERTDGRSTTHRRGHDQRETVPAARTSSEPVDTKAARGNGTPAIRRPFKVAHLP